MKMAQFISITLVIILGMFLNSCGQMTYEDEGMSSKSIEESSGATDDTTTTDNTTTTDDTTTTTFTVSSVSPTDGQTSVSRTPDIIITFSDDIYTGYSAWTSTATVTGSCSSSSFNWKVVHVSSDNFSQCVVDNGTVSGKTITLNLNGILSASTTYKIKIMKTSSDGTWTTQSTSGTQLSSDYTYSFTTQ
jgi:hypothetical protein